jgi:hypothetical protein
LRAKNTESTEHSQAEVERHDAAVFAELDRLRDSGQLLLARLRWLLTNEARSVAKRLRRDGIAVTAENIATGLMLVVGTAQPRSRFVPWHLDDVTVEKMIAVVANDLAATLKAAA